MGRGNRVRVVIVAMALLLVSGPGQTTNKTVPVVPGSIGTAPCALWRPRSTAGATGRCCQPALRAATGEFTQAPTSPEGAGDQPSSVAIGRFNVDAIDDLAVANGASDSVTILLGNGTGDFTQAPTSPEVAGDQPVSVTVGRFNADTIDDLAVANFLSDDLTVLLGDGMGNFAQAPTSPEAAGNQPFSISVGRFNGDAIDDLAVPNGVSDDLSNEVTILIGDGTGNFTEAPTSPEDAGLDPYSVAVGRFNADAIDDLAVANHNAHNLTIFLGDGMGDFTETPTSPESAGNFPNWIVAGRFNADAIDDLAVTNDDTDDVTILLGDGTGNFTQPATSPEAAGDIPFSVNVGRFNADAIDDLAVVNQGSADVTILFGDGTGNFTEAPTSPETAGNGPFAGAVGRFNADDVDDLAVANAISDDVTIVLNGGDGTVGPCDAPTITGTPGDERDRWDEGERRDRRPRWQRSSGH